MHIPRSVVQQQKNKFPTKAHEESGSSYLIKEPGTGEVLVAIGDNGHGGYADAQKKFGAKFPLDLSPLPTNAQKNAVDENENIIPHEDFDQEVHDQLLEESPDGFIPSVADLRCKIKGKAFSCKVSHEHKHHSAAMYTSDQEAKASDTDNEYANFKKWQKAQKNAAPAEVDEEEFAEPAAAKKPAAKKKKSR